MNILSPEEYISQYLTFLEKEKAYAAFTISSYRTDLHQFARFLPQLHFDQIRAHHIHNFLEYLYGKNYSNTTLSRKLSALRSFFKYVISRNIITSNPLQAVPNPKRRRKLPYFIREDELVEVTPKSIRLRKTALGAQQRHRLRAANDRR